jgi:hypothetical protein
VRPRGRRARLRHSDDAETGTTGVRSGGLLRGEITDMEHGGKCQHRGTNAYE